MKHIYYLTFIVLLALIAHACDDTGDGITGPFHPEGNIDITLKNKGDTISTFGDNGGEKSISFIAKAPWQVEQPQARDSWVKINPRIGFVGNCTINLKVVPNETDSCRKTMFYIKTESDRIPLTISQAGKGTFVVAEKQYDMPQEGGEIKVEISHDGDFDIDITADWIKQVSTRATMRDTLTFNVLPNEGAARTDSIIFAQGQRVQVVKVAQEGKSQEPDQETEVDKYLDDIKNYVKTIKSETPEAAVSDVSAWIKEQPGVKQVEVKDNFISFTLESGEESFVAFEDIETGAEQQEATAPLFKRSASEEIPVYEADEEEGEEIIENRKVLLMLPLYKYWWIFPNWERKHFLEVVETFPVNIELEEEQNGYISTIESFNEYGMVIVTDTHGYGNANSGFAISCEHNPNVDHELVEKGLLLEYGVWDIHALRVTPIDSYLVKAKYVKEKSGLYDSGNKTIYVTLFCNSWQHGDACNGNFVGLQENALRWYNTYVLQDYTRNFFGGCTHEESVAEIRPDTLTVLKPKSPYPTQRYFSFRFDPAKILKDKVKISGKVNGLNNLRNDIDKNKDFKLFYTEGEKFDVTKAREMNIPVDDQGMFSEEFGIEVFDSGKRYQVAVGFKYKGRYFISKPQSVFILVKDEDNLRKVLTTFYNETNGKSWFRNDNWCTNAPLKEWYGVNFRENEGEYELEIFLEGNNLTGRVNLRNLPELKKLHISKNEFESVDLSGCTNLKSASFDSDALTTINISNCSSLEKFISHNSNKNVTSVKAKGCTSMRTFAFEDTKATTIDLSGCTSLTQLSCTDNKLTHLDITGCKSLVWFSCSNNNLTTIDLRNLPNLDILNCSKNQLTQINPEHSEKLVTIIADDLPLTVLDLHGFKMLDGVSLMNTEIDKLNLSECSALRLVTLAGDSTIVKNINISNCTKIEKFDCDGCEVQSLNVTNCTNLRSLICSRNNLTTLHLNGCKNLIDLNCSENNIASLNVSESKETLEALNCSHNSLSDIGVEGYPKLRDLDCDHNFISREISKYFYNLPVFDHDQKYFYKDTGEWVDGEFVIEVITNDHGWWYPGEPGSMMHTPPHEWLNENNDY